MTRRGSWSAIGVVLLSLAFVVPARADAVVQQTTVETDEDEGPSIISHGYQGLLAGAVVGLSGGYLAARRGDWEKSDWRAVGLGIGIGALSGAALGLSCGFLDKGGSPAGRYISRDLMAGTGFGAVLGAISGAISAGINSEPEHILFGASIGVLAGAGVGIITGIVEGQTKARRAADNSNTTVVSRLHLTPSLAWARTVDGKSSVLPALASRF